MKLNDRIPHIDTQKQFAVLFFIMGIIIAFPYKFSSMWLMALGTIFLIAFIFIVLLLDLKLCLFLFSAAIAVAPPLYLIISISPIARSIRLYEILFTLIVLLAFMDSTRGTKTLFHRTPIDIPVIGIVFIWTVSVFYGSYLDTTFNLRDFFEFLKPIRLFLIAQIIIYSVNERKDIKYIIYILVFCSSYPQILGIFEHLNFVGVRRFLATVYPGYEYSSDLIVGAFDVYGTGFLHKFRTSSIFVGDVNAFGGYSALFFLMALLLFVYIPEIKYRVLYAIISLLNLYGVLISGSRKSILCIFFGLMTIFILKFRRILKSLPIFFLSFLLALKFTPAMLANRMFEHWDYKIRNIIQLWSEYKKFDLTTLLIGKGAVHEFGLDNFYLKLLMKNGMLGLIAHFILILFILKTSGYVIRNSQHWIDDVSGVMVIVLTVSIEWLNMTGLYFYCGRISESYWIIIGVMLLCYSNLNKERMIK